MNAYMPAAVWERLSSNFQLAYRVFTSSSASSWADTAMSISDDEIAFTPTMTIVD